MRMWYVIAWNGVFRLTRKRRAKRINPDHNELRAATSWKNERTKRTNALFKQTEQWVSMLCSFFFLSNNFSIAMRTSSSNASHSLCVVDQAFSCFYSPRSHRSSLFSLSISICSFHCHWEETVDDVEFLFECHIEDLQAKQRFLSRQLSIFDWVRMRLFGESMSVRLTRSVSKCLRSQVMNNRLSRHEKGKLIHARWELSNAF